MFNRALWKKMKLAKKPGIPEGVRRRCKCGKLTIFEVRPDQVLVHHEIPYCADYEKIVGIAEHLELTAADASEVKVAIDSMTGKEE